MRKSRLRRGRQNAFHTIYRFSLDFNDGKSYSMSILKNRETERMAYSFYRYYSYFTGAIR